VFVVIDELMLKLGHKGHVLAGVADAEVLTVAVVAAKSFQNHQERALQVMQLRGYLSGRLSASRFNRRLHKPGDQLLLLSSEVLGGLFATGEAYPIDGVPVPVCKRARARRCKKVRGAEYCGYCAAKKEKYYGWKLHLVCTIEGIPVAFTLLPASLHDLTPVHELTQGLPEDSSVYGDKGYNSSKDEASILADTGVRLVPVREKNQTPNLPHDRVALRRSRKQVETLFSQLESMGVQRLRARTTAGIELKLLASLFAVLVTNLD
jgi:hypothetical protein